MFSPRSFRGFSIIEILVSLFILGVVLVLFQAALHIVVLGKLAKDRDIALRIATNQLETLRGVGYAGLPASGSFANANLSLLATGEGEQTISTYNDKTKEVVVEVTWTEKGGTEPHSVSLTTLITETGGLP